jgi:hypothetical protein
MLAHSTSHANKFLITFYESQQTVGVDCVRNERTQP